MNVRAVIVAAGPGRRMRSGPTDPSKVYMPIGSRPVLSYALESIARIPEVDQIIVVVSPGQEDDCRERVANSFGIEKVARIIAGGSQRSDSVWNGLNVLGDAAEWVLIHDGARPFPPNNKIPGLLHAARECGAATLGIPVKPTIKEVEPGGKVVRTLNRDALRDIQTPQVFRRDVIRHAYESADRELRKMATDDAYLVEQTGGQVRVVEGDERNIKITTPFDIQLAERLLENNECTLD